jgi:hypothetical protein
MAQPITTSPCAEPLDHFRASMSTQFRLKAFPSEIQSWIPFSVPPWSVTAPS